MNRIKELCIQKGIEQKQLAIMVGVSQPTVSDWFNNKKNPRGERLDKLSEVLGVSRAYLLGYAEEPSQPPKTALMPSAEDPAYINRILEARKASGLSQKYVAMTLGVAGPSVSNWESGKTKPTPENFISLAQLFGVTVDYLMGVDDAPPIQVKEEQPAQNDELLTGFRDLLSQMNEDQRKQTEDYMRFLISQRKGL